MNLSSGNRDCLSVAIFVTELTFSFGTSVKFLGQATKFIERDRRQFGGLLFAVSEVFNFYGFSDGRITHQVFDLIVIANLLSVDTQNHVAANETGFVRRSARRVDALEDHALI